MRSTSACPNILFAITDDWSFGHAGAYGCEWVRTPAFDSVARQGLLFLRSHTPNAKCAPSRACILTGRNPWQLKEACNHIGFFPPEFKVFPEALAEAGYFVGATNKGWAPGVALQADGSPRALVGQQFDSRRMTPPTPMMNSNDYTANFGDFLDAAPADQPWCFWYGSSDPHRPYERGSGMAKGGKKLTEIDRVPAYWPDCDETRSDLLDYAYAVEYFDRHLAGMLALLDQRGMAENTLVIVTSDHGMPFPRAKGQAYPFSNHLPLAIRWPVGISHPGRIIDGFVSHTDLAPTILEAAGIPFADSGLAAMSGISLSDVFRAETPERSAATSRNHILIGQERHDVGRPHDQGYPIRGLINRDWIFLENFEPERWPACNPETGYLNCDGSPTKTLILDQRYQPGGSVNWQRSFGQRVRQELYDLRSDPDCLENRASAETTVLEKLRRQLFEELRQEEDPRLVADGRVFDGYLVAQPEMRSFYEQWERGTAPATDWVELSDYRARD